MGDTPIIHYQTGIHLGQPVIWLRFKYNKDLINKVKQLPSCKWSQSQKCWYVPDTEENRGQFGLATPSMAIVKLYGSNSPRATATPIYKAQANSACPYKINGHVLPAMQQQLVLKAYSPSTITTYSREIGAFLATIKNTAPTVLLWSGLKTICNTALQHSG